MSTPSYIEKNKQTKIAYFHTSAKAKDAPQVMFLCGYRSDMEGTKAIALEAHCKKAGIGFTRFDYTGHGVSDGDFEKDGCIGTWLEDTLLVLDKVVKGPVILVGSSMGGWLALLAAIARKKQVVGVLGVASAPDFTESLMWDSLSGAQQKKLLKDGRLEVPTEYTDTPSVITKKLLEESAEHFLLDKPSIPLNIPIRLLHGMKDADVPFEFSLAINEKVDSKDVRVNLLPEGDHRLSTPSDIAILCKTLDKLMAHIAETAKAA